MYDLVRMFFSSHLNVALLMGAVTLGVVLHHLINMRYAKAKIMDLELQIGNLKHHAEFSESRAKEITMLQRENAQLKRTMYTEIDRISATAKQEVANAKRDANAAKGRSYPNVHMTVAKGVFSHAEQSFVDGIVATTVHFKSGMCRILPCYWKPTMESGTPIELTFNYKTGAAYAEVLVPKATPEKRKAAGTYLRVVGTKPSNDKPN